MRVDQVATCRGIRRLVEAVLKEECARGVAMIVVTHDQAQPERLSARRFAMERGKLEP